MYNSNICYFAAAAYNELWRFTLSSTVYSLTVHMLRSNNQLKWCYLLKEFIVSAMSVCWTELPLGLRVGLKIDDICFYWTYQIESDLIKIYSYNLHIQTVKLTQKKITRYCYFEVLISRFEICSAFSSSREFRKNSNFCRKFDFVKTTCRDIKDQNRELY